VNDQLSVLKLVTARLDAARIPYMITGSIAAGLYARPRMTRDIDLVVKLQVDDAERLAEIFGDEFECDAAAIRTAISRQSLFNLIHTEAVVKVDFIVRKSTPYREVEFDRRRPAIIYGDPVWIVSPEDLILSKLLWAKDSRSELQLGDVRQLITAQPSLDWPYLDRWAGTARGHRIAARDPVMNDTSPEIDEHLRDLFMKHSGSDRVRMVCDMFDCARALLVAGLEAEYPDISPAELRVKIFERTYGSDFDADSRARIIARPRA
jgi:hypothetical protein